WCLMHTSRQNARRPRLALHLEALEDRATPATITVNTLTDDLTPNDGSVSLREAIMAINSGSDLGDPAITAQNPGTFGINDTINFNLSGSGVQTIGVGTDPSASGVPLPSILKRVIINGYSQPGASMNTQPNGDDAKVLIYLDGSAAGANADGLLL